MINAAMIYPMMIPAIVTAASSEMPVRSVNIPIAKNDPLNIVGRIQGITSPMMSADARTAMAITKTVRIMCCSSTSELGRSNDAGHAWQPPAFTNWDWSLPRQQR